MKFSKKIVIIVIVFSFLISCNLTNDESNDIEIISYIETNYSLDAKLLYMNEIFNDTNHPNHNNSTLNEIKINAILKNIQAVYNLNSPETDTIFNINEIHTRLCYSFNTLNIKVNVTAPEIVNLVANNLPTQNPTLNSILNSYNYNNVDPTYSYPSFPWLTLIFNGDYNMIPISNELQEIESVITTELNSICIGDGNSINFKRHLNYNELTFNIGSGDCPSGCIFKRFWEFRIINNTATFIRAYNN